MTMTRRLPAALDSLVRQIETDIGERFDHDVGSAEPAHDRAIATAEPEGGVEQAVREILREIGEDPDREGLIGTPERVHRMYGELLAGYRVDPDRLLNDAIFEVDYSEMVVVDRIEFYSLCEHHLLPFYGTAAVAYVPRGRVVGLSKIPRIVEMYARRLQVQERMTQQIADFVQERLDPQGVGVVVEATHLCMVMRGVRSDARITTAALHGLMQTRDRTRAEFLAHLERGG
jgi:GTP cyclohydrolase I